MEPNRESQSASATAPLTRRLLLHACLALAAGAALRIWMLAHWFDVYGDPLVYGGIAKNLLLHGRYWVMNSSGITGPTLIRLPGYPFFLAACFKLFGMENYFAPVCIQIAVELAGCLLLAAFARAMAAGFRTADAALGRRACIATLWLSALCPFTASYALRPITETLTLFTLALAIFAMAWFWQRPAWPPALVFTFAVTCCTLLRPDGALAALAFAPVMLIATRKRCSLLASARMIVVCVLLALAPFAAWGWRNWRVFHVFQPLAPRLAIDPADAPNLGWERWMKSWCLDFVSTFEIYWRVPGGAFDVSALPARAFDSEAQRQETVALAQDYNKGGMLFSPEIDARFAHLADERLAAHPWRTRLWLPLGRLADMWLRPRNEVLPVELDWWVWSRHPQQTAVSWALAALNLIYLALAAAGLWLRPRFGMALATYMILRSLLLLTVQAPEARYTLECFPMLFVLGGVALAAGARRFATPPPAC